MFGFAAFNLGKQISILFIAHHSLPRQISLIWSRPAAMVLAWWRVSATSQS